MKNNFFIAPAAKKSRYLVDTYEEWTEVDICYKDLIKILKDVKWLFWSFNDKQREEIVTIADSIREDYEHKKNVNIAPTDDFVTPFDEEE